ncbi:alpha/beta hydrolase [Pseudoduganella lutea]|uniref:alpha/beta hydrolase n=1 Tax=Pseudoduganella lutea TaxID=321985 RepID=UPI0013EED9CB|nr:alpha/beta hydrolase [Pseudoduganella lutea]
MTPLESAITRLSDEKAVQYVNQLIRACHSPSTVQLSGEDVASAIGLEFSLPCDAVDVPSYGDVARSVLLLLASNFQQRIEIEALINTPKLLNFGKELVDFDPIKVLNILQSQFNAFNFLQSGAQASPRWETAQPGLLRAVGQNLLTCAGFRTVDPVSDAEYKIWYATTRSLVDRADPSKGYGVQHDGKVHYGSCTVFVPKSHKIGSVGSPWWKRILTCNDDRLQLLAVERVAEETFWASVALKLSRSPIEERDAVIFVHGFNVDFEEAALRTAQIGFDMQVKGAMAFFSWASRGEANMYLADAATIELDEMILADYLCDFARYSGARRVHVIAHSMGNRAVLRAVDRIAGNAQRRTGIQFGQFILAAPDVDVRKFQQHCAAYRAISDRTTLYVSSRDMAVEASRWLHDFPRAGLVPPVTVAEGIDTINVVNADLTLLGHGYVAEARSVINDMHSLIQHGAAPQSRFGIRLTSTEQGHPYWMIGA